MQKTPLRDWVLDALPDKTRAQSLAPEAADSLGAAPAVGEFLGLPIDIRNVTLSAGLLALAASALDVNWLAEEPFVRGVAVIAVMFALNLSVSFLLSLFYAARARGLDAETTGGILRKVLVRFVRHPVESLVP